MSVIGRTVKSKATGLKGIITGISGNKLSVCFEGNISITVPVSALDIDEETMKLIESEIKTTSPESSSSYISRKDNQKTEIVYDKIDILDAKDRIPFYRVADVLNTCFGTDYKAWMKGEWQVSNLYWCWFPKLVKTLKDEPAAFGCVNVISEDWNTLIYDEHKITTPDTSNDPHDDRSVIFAREPDNGPIFVRGVYVYDHEQSSFKHYVHKRIATKIRVIGNPAYNIELLDKVE